MDLISELESEFTSLTETQPLTQVVVKVGAQSHILRFPELGLDYLAGLANERLWVFPLATISELLGSALPSLHEQTLEQFLKSQRTPVRVRLSSNEDATNCWLLNISPGWVRVSMSKGVSWLPISSISRLEILPVDN